ncbi:MAG: sigma 54-interacting transcriptional regulator [Candidatus Eisenbacteria bacterium]
MKRTQPINVGIRRDEVQPPKGDWIRLLGIADVHFGADNLVSALEYYERALVVARTSDADPSELFEIELKKIDALQRRSRHVDALHASEDLLSRVDRVDAPVPYARALARVGAAQSALSRWDDAQVVCSEAYEVLRTTSAHQEVATLLLTMGVISHRQGNLPAAQTHYESALSTFRRIGDSEGLARVLNNLGTLVLFTPRWREGKEYLLRAVAVAEEAGNYARIASLCLNLGILSYMTCEWALASAYLTRALAISNETAPARAQRSQLALGRMKLRRREFAAAESHFLQVCDSARENGWTRDESLALEFLGERALREGEFERAGDYLSKALEIARTVSPANDVVGELETRVAELLLAQGDAAGARTTAERALGICLSVEDAVEIGRALRIRGEAELALGMLPEARASFEQAVRHLDGTPDAIEQELARVARARYWFRAEKHGRVEPGDGVAQGTIALERACQRFLDLEIAPLAVNCLFELSRGLEENGSLDDALAAVDRAIDLAEKHGVTRGRQPLLDLRSSLEERYAETSLSRSIEFQVLADVSAYGLEGSQANLGTYLEAASERAKADRVLLAVSSRGHGICVEASHGFADDLPNKATLAALLAAVDDGNRILVVGDPKRDPRFELSGSFADGVRSATAIPLQLSGGAKGLLYADRHTGSAEGRFRVADLRLLSFFAGLLAVFFAAREGERRAAGRDSSPDSDDSSDALSRFLTCDAEMKRALHLLRRLDRSDAGVLVTGETGTGKGLLSRLIHDSGRRSAGPFVPVNCAALPETLLESELFGHEQGAFTGAVRTKRGLFEEAEGGTLFLDEVDKAPLAVQAKLLHVLDKHEIRPVGSTQWKPVDVRVVCATNADLRSAIQAGKFLEDLYYRLNDFQVHIPPLRERRADVPLLVRHFVEEFKESLGRPNTTFSRNAVEALTDHDWRGNVRELEKVVKRVLVLAEDGEQITVESLPREVRTSSRAAEGPVDSGTLRSAVERLEAELIGSSLEAAGGNKSEVARRLQVSYPCLLTKIRKYGLEPRNR